MVSINIDGKFYLVNKQNNLLAICLSLGFDIPYFCWHPALGSVGSCRQCAVKRYKNMEDMHGQLVMACMTPIIDGLYISILDDEASKFRSQIIELLMINHPHDCPVCSEGGSCHLQDMTIMTRHNYRRYRFNKRTHKNQYLGPFINHEMNRCIACYRCVRYYKHYADGNDLGVYGSRDNVYFGRFKEGILNSEFSGNLVEVCPTGVFTDKTNINNYSRKWDMRFSPSICQQCSIGCNIVIGERYGEICCIENRYNGSVNGYFLCDLGRFGHGYVNLKDRPKHPMQRNCDNDTWITLGMDESLTRVTNVLLTSDKVIGIGSSRASVESNFALKELVGEKNFFVGIDDAEYNRMLLILNILQNSGIYIPSLKEIEGYDAILILGEDLTQTSARMALAVRQAIKNKAKNIASIYNIPHWDISAVMNAGGDAKYPLFITSVDTTKLDDIASWIFHASADNQARFAFALAHIIDCDAPAVCDLDCYLHDKLSMIAQALLAANKPLIISGSNSGSMSLLSAAANVAKSLKNRNKDVGISLVSSNANDLGLTIIGGNYFSAALYAMRSGLVDCVIILENHLYRYASKIIIDQSLLSVKNIIVLDHQYHTFHDKANFILSTTAFTESDGTLINQEGRAQRFFRCYQPDFYDKNTVILESWRWLYLLKSRCLNQDYKNFCFDNVIDDIVKKMPGLSSLKEVAPDASSRVRGQKLIRISPRNSGHTAMHTDISVHEPSVASDNDSMFTFSSEGNNNLQQSCSQHIALAWLPGWNSNQVWNKLQREPGNSLYYGDPGVRLFNNIQGQTLDWFSIIPNKCIPTKQAKRLQIVPYWHLFGSEEMSQRLVVIKKCMPKLYVCINYSDATYYGLNKDMHLQFNCAGEVFCLPIKFSYNLDIGCIGLPLGFPGIPPFLSGMFIDKWQGVFL